MPYRLRDDLSYCREGDRFVFLDVLGDRYFRLPVPLERAFTAFVSSDEVCDREIAQLVENNILVEATRSDHRQHAQLADLPDRSVLEIPIAPPRVKLGILFEVSHLVCSTRRQLRVSTLKNVIDNVISDRVTWTGLCSEKEPPEEHKLLDAACLFLRIRPHIPVPTMCLLDSLSMVRFLSRRKLFADIVFGVAFEPFAAHCWVQAGNLALNETVGDAAAYTPIRRI